MKKIFQIGFKDLLILLRDPGSLLLMLLAPYLLTVGFGFVTGSVGGDGLSATEAVPVVIVNQDTGELGQVLVTLFESPEVADFVAATVGTDEAVARQQVNDDAIAAAIVIPPGFSAGIIPAATAADAPTAVPVEIYASPARPVGVSIVEAVVQDFVARTQQNVGAVEIVISQLVETGRLTPAQIPATAEELAQQLAAEGSANNSAVLVTETIGANSADSGPNALTILAPAMAVFFLILTATTGARSILEEWEEGTLPRLLTTPTKISQVLAGKTLGIFMMGYLQMAILILASGLMFRLSWGNPLAVALLLAPLSAAATGWGLLLVAVSKSATQVSSLGSAMMLIFGILGGSLVTISFTGIMNVISHLTPNAWAADGFRVLANGGTLVDILPIMGALLLMAAVLFAISNYSLLRRWV